MDNGSVDLLNYDGVDPGAGAEAKATPKPKVKMQRWPLCEFKGQPAIPWQAILLQKAKHKKLQRLQLCEFKSKPSYGAAIQAAAAALQMGWWHMLMFDHALQHEKMVFHGWETARLYMCVCVCMMYAYVVAL